MAGIGTVPLYRLIRQHLWTADAYENDVLGGRGWRREGVAGHVLP